MAAVVLALDASCVLNSAADPSDYSTFRLSDGLQHAPSVTIDSQLAADGNFYPILTPGSQKTAKVTINVATDVQVAWLKAHQGLLLCYRDARGEKFYGFYGSDLTFSPQRYGDDQGGVTQVTFTMTQTFFDETAS